MFLNEHLKTPVTAEYDVVVCGGGIAGISAALAAARRQKRTLLLERQFLLGGLGTLGLVTIYLPLCDGCGRQVSFGIAEELLRLSISQGAEGRLPENWLSENGSRTRLDPRFEVQYNPQLFAISVEKLLRDHGVDLLYGVSVTGVVKEGDRITHLLTESKSGRQAIYAGAVVDATGDCDIAAFSGAPTENFQQGNVLAAWYYSVGKDGYHLRSLGACDIPEEEKKEGGAVTPLIDQRFLGLSTQELSRMTELSHRTLWEDFLRHRKEDPTYLPVTMATIPQIRMTRKLQGEYELSHKEEHCFFPDSIGMVSNWKKRGPVYEVPFRTLYHHSVKNLIAAGRCTSTDETLWDVMRVIPCCAVTGEAAGTAAAMADDFSSLSVEALQEELKRGGVILHEKEL